MRSNQLRQASCIQARGEPSRIVFVEAVAGDGRFSLIFTMAVIDRFKTAKFVF
jgi:hypothetical protein